MQEKQIEDLVQDKFNNYLNGYSHIVPVPYFKTFKETLKSIAVANVPIVRKIAQYMPGDVSVKKKSERITYHLDNKKSFDILNQANLIKCSRKLKENDIINFDNSDIVKPKANKMEFLNKVRDGSTKEFEKGYYTTNVMSVQLNGKKSHDVSLSPMYSYTYSTDGEIESANDRNINLINEITLSSNNKGIFNFDRGYDDKKLISALVENENDFVIRAAGQRDIIIDGQKMSFSNASKKVKLKYEYKDLIKGKKVYFGVKQVEIITDPHPLKNPNTVKMWFIVAKFEGKGGFFQFFANFKNSDKMARGFLGEKVIEVYGFRWKIEEYFRHVKQEYQWEKIQLLKYQRIQSLNLWLLILVCFIYSCKDLLALGHKDYNNFLFDTKKDITMTQKFSYYRISHVIKLIFLKIKGRKRKPYKRKVESKNQMTLFDLIEQAC